MISVNQKNPRGFSTVCKVMFSKSAFLDNTFSGRFVTLCQYVISSPNHLKERESSLVSLYTANFGQHLDTPRTYFKNLRYSMSALMSDTCM